MFCERQNVSQFSSDELTVDGNNNNNPLSQYIDFDILKSMNAPERAQYLANLKALHITEAPTTVVDMYGNYISGSSRIITFGSIAIIDAIPTVFLKEKPSLYGFKSKYSVKAKASAIEATLVSPSSSSKPIFLKPKDNSCLTDGAKI